MESAHRTRLARGEVGISTRKHVTLLEPAEIFKTFIGRRSAERPETIKFYRSKLRRLLEYKPLAAAQINAIDETLIEQYVQHRRETVSPAAVNRDQSHRPSTRDLFRGRSRGQDPKDSAGGSRPAFGAFD